MRISPNRSFDKLRIAGSSLFKELFRKIGRGNSFLKGKTSGIFQAKLERTIG
jgi:hypothetical protein